MRQQVHFITLATIDLDATRGFYVTAMGWSPLADVEGEIIFFQVAPGLVLGFFDAEKFNQDLDTSQDRSPISGVTLSHNVAGREEVTVLVDAMVAAGARMLKAPQQGGFGGIFHAHVQDPNGVTWEIAHNPGWSVDDEGNVAFA